MNPSISYTLDKCHTSFEVFFKRSESPKNPTFYFEGILAPEFGSKSFKLIDKIASDFPALKNYELILNSKTLFLTPLELLPVLHR